MSYELFIDDLASDASLSFDVWRVDEQTDPYPDLKIEASPYYGDLGPERALPMELVIQFGDHRTIVGDFFHDDCGDVLRLVCVGYERMTCL